MISDSTVANGLESSKRPDVVPTPNTRPRYDVQRGIRQSNSERSRASKKRVIKMLFAVVFEFFVCWTPMFIVQNWIIIDTESAERYVTNELSSYYILFYEQEFQAGIYVSIQVLPPS